MNKLLVTIEVPAVEQVFDLTVPWDLSAKLLIELLYQLLKELGNGLYMPSHTEVLCRREDGRLLMQDRTLQENDVHMGDHLILF